MTGTHKLGGRNNLISSTTGVTCMIPQCVREIEIRYKEKIREDLNLGRSMSFGQNLNGSGKYGWFSFRQAFPRKLLDHIFSHTELADPHVILDPFMGSGNVLLASVERGQTAYGIDVSPFFQFITYMKTRRIPSRAFDGAISIVLKADKLPLDYTKIPPLSSFDRLFRKNTLAHLLNVLNTAHDAGEAGDVAKFAVAATLLDFSRAARWGKGLRIVHKRPHYRSSMLIEKIKQMRVDQVEFEKKEKLGRAIPLLGDVKEDFENLHDIRRRRFRLSKSSGINMVITSPPYCNSSDYIEMYKLEHWILGYISDKEEFNCLSNSTIRSHTSFNDGNTKWKHEVVEDVASRLEKKDLWSDKIPAMLRGYASDLYLALKNMVNLLNDGGRMFIVEGNSCYGGIPIPFDLVLADAVTDMGLNVKKIIASRYLLTSSQQRKLLEAKERKILRESILIINA